MRDLLTDIARFAAAGTPFGRAVVTSVWGSAPRAEGACLIATADGAIVGSVSGGCVESAAAAEIIEAIARRTPKLITYGVSHETAWEVGLACGGTINVFVEPAVRPELIEAAEGSGGVALATVIEGPATGVAVVVREDGTVTAPLPPAGTSAETDADLPDEVLAAIRDAALSSLRFERGGAHAITAADADRNVMIEVFPRQPRLVIFGGVHVAMALVPLANALGYRTIVADGRESFLTRDRFPAAHELLLAWPDEAFAQIGLDRSCYVCVLSHDPKFDEPALEIALRSEATYVGAIGSRKTQTSRRARLRELGISGEQLARLRGPIGLDLGGRSPAETALAILAEMTAVRYGGTGRAMTETTEKPERTEKLRA